MRQPLEQPYTKIGGARVGWMNVTWPFAELWAAPERLVITAQMLGSYTFKPEQVLTIEPYVRIPVLGWGIRVRHRVADYPERIIFWSFANPNKILRGVRASGFLPAAGRVATELAGSPMHADRGLPIRLPVVIGVVVAWNALLLLDFAGFRPGPPRPGWPSCLALALVFSLSFSALVSPAILTLVLKPNRSVGEIRPFLRVLALVSGLMLLFFLVFRISSGFTLSLNKPAACSAGAAPTLAVQHSSPGVLEPGRTP